MPITVLKALKKKQMLKAKKPLSNLLQIYLNKLVDKKVNQAYDTRLEEYGGYDSFSKTNIFNTIFNFNNASTQRDFQKILSSPYTSNDAIFKQTVRINAENTAKIVSEAEVERVLKNLEYVEKTLQQAKVDIKEYNRLADSLEKTTSRHGILEKALEEGEMFTGRELSYRELDQLSRNLESYKLKKVDYDEACAINEEARANGLPDVYTHKKWLWSQLENTRHQGMDGEVVEFYDLFEVVNEVSGSEDRLLFPGDLENYYNPDQIINCQCDVEYLTSEEYEADLKEKENVPLRQMFEDEKLNKETAQFEKENNNSQNEHITISSNGEVILSNHTDELSNRVFVPSEIEELAKKNGLDYIIHNHPNDIALLSGGDIYKAISLRTKYLVSTTSGNYNAVIINNSSNVKYSAKLEKRAIKYQNKFYNIENEMKINFLSKNSDYANLDYNSKKFKKGIADYYQKDENMLPYYKKFKDILPKDIELKLYNKKIGKYI
ncbi:MAG: hypothetical protein LBU40_06780 [Methanobrevibacter sp.]|nr:hypothetical protein [Methanobrevibacter sp.]